MITPVSSKGWSLRGVLPPRFLPEKLLRRPFKTNLFSPDSLGYVPKLSGHST